MALELKIVEIGDSLGIVLPEDVLKRLGVQLGDTLAIAKIPGGIQLTPLKAEDSEWMKAAEHVMRENREVLKKLADS